MFYTRIYFRLPWWILTCISLGLSGVVWSLYQDYESDQALVRSALEHDLPAAQSLGAATPVGPFEEVRVHVYLAQPTTVRRIEAVGPDYYALLVTDVPNGAPSGVLIERSSGDLRNLAINNAGAALIITGRLLPQREIQLAPLADFYGSNAGGGAFKFVDPFWETRREGLKTVSVDADILLIVSAVLGLNTLFAFAKWYRRGTFKIVKPRRRTMPKARRKLRRDKRDEFLHSPILEQKTLFSRLAR